MSPLGKVWTNCLKNHNVISMYPPVNWPLSPSGYDSLLIGPDLWPSWQRPPSSPQPIVWLIPFDISTPSFAFLYHSCDLLFYDHAIMILTTLTTHIFSYLYPTLPGLSLDSHSFDYSFLSCLCSFLLSPSHSLCNHSIFTYDVLPLELLSVMATLVYIV